MKPTMKLEKRLEQRTFYVKWKLLSMNVLSLELLTGRNGQ